MNSQMLLQETLQLKEYSNKNLMLTDKKKKRRKMRKKLLLESMLK